MKTSHLTRPDKLLTEGLKAFGNLTQALYTGQKKAAKAKAQLTYIGEEKKEDVETQRYTYNESACQVTVGLSSFDFIEKPLESEFNHWLNFHGVHEVSLIEKIGRSAKLDRLTIRYILDTTQRPKIEAYEHYLFLGVKSIIKDTTGELDVEQISFVLSKQYVISFQEKVGDHFEDIRSKLNEGLGFIRLKSSDYLLNQLLDAILDNYFETIDQMNMEISAIEKAVFNKPEKSILLKIETLKKSANIIRKALGPFKENLINLSEDDSTFIKVENRRHFRDVTNTASAAIEEIDVTLKNLESLTNVYFAALSQNMNEVMKVLTTVATIFIPLTFIAGIYGMNFSHMPELSYRYGYFITWGVMLTLATGMLIYFRRKRWI